MEKEDRAVHIRETLDIIDDLVNDDKFISDLWSYSEILRTERTRELFPIHHLSGH